MTEVEMIAAIQVLAQQARANIVPRREFLRATGISERQITRLFGSYNGLVEAASLNPVSFPTTDQPTYSDEHILNEIVRVLRLPDSKMTRIFFEQNASVSSSVCERRLGGWINALRQAVQALDPLQDRTLIERIAEYTSPKLSVSPLDSTINGAEPSDHLVAQGSPGQHLDHQFIPLDSANVYGDFINFRGLQHAPVNEQGVVFLFGMTCLELGYVVEIVKSAFPDCEAKRIIRGKPGKWQRVRIEFEYSSRNFKTHGHDPDQCDVIVCWEHNWPDCPIEVLELRSEMAKLSNAFVSPDARKGVR